MILLDSSVWVDHLRRPIDLINDLSDNEEILTHPYVVGEVMLGSIKDRNVILRHFLRLPMATTATDDETLTFIERNSLFGSGIGYLDAHLLAATRLTDGARLWTFDRRLHALAVKLGLAADLPRRMQH